MMSLPDMERQEKQKKFLQKVSPVRTASGRIKKVKVSTMEETRKYLEAGMGLKEIAGLRGAKIGTILDHVEKLLAEDPKLDIRHLESEITPAKFKKIWGVFNSIYGENRELRLSPVMKILGGENSGFFFEHLRLVRLFLKKRGM